MEQQPILVISVLISFTILGVVLGRMTSTKSVDDFALGGRSLGFFPSLMTLSGTFVSAVTLMVYTSFVYIYGISAAWIFVGYTLGFLFFIPFALKLYRLSLEHNFFTLTDYFVFRYGRRTARWAYTDPFDPDVVLGSGYQLANSLISIGQGGFLGLGLGNSFQKNFFLPEAHTDFIFAVLVEELGVIGGIFLIAVYVVLFIGMLNVALSCMKLKRVFQGLVCFGTTILFASPGACHPSLGLQA